MARRRKGCWITRVPHLGKPGSVSHYVGKTAEPRNPIIEPRPCWLLPWLGWPRSHQDIGEGRIDPVHGNRMVRNLTGGYDIPDVIEHALSMIGEFGKLAAKPVR